MFDKNLNKYFNQKTGNKKLKIYSINQAIIY